MDSFERFMWVMECDDTEEAREVYRAVKEMWLKDVSMSKFEAYEIAERMLKEERQKTCITVK